MPELEQNKRLIIDLVTWLLRDLKYLDILAIFIFYCVHVAFPAFLRHAAASCWTSCCSRLMPTPRDRIPIRSLAEAQVATFAKPALCDLLICTLIENFGSFLMVLDHARKATFRQKENPLVLYLYQGCDEDGIWRHVTIAYNRNMLIQALLKALN